MRAYREISRLGQELVATNEERRKLASVWSAARPRAAPRRDNTGHAASA